MLDKWGNIYATEVTKKMVADIILDEVKRCKREKFGNSRPNQLLKVVKANMNYAMRNFGVEMQNPAEYISRLPEDRKIKFIPKKEMIVAAQDLCSPEQRLLVQFVYETGCRINEAIALEYTDVKEKYVVLYTRKSRNSARVPRFVPRPTCISTSGKGKVFKFWNTYPRFLGDNVKKLKHERWNWHSLRHLRASIWADSDVALFKIQMLLGHSQI